MNKTFLTVKLCSIFTFISFLSCCVQTNPSHKASIIGKMLTNMNSQGDLCFAPNFSTATLMNKSVEDRLKFIKLSAMQLRDNEVVKNSKIVWSIVPNIKSEYRLKDKQYICMNANYKNLEVQKKDILQSQTYTISLYGVDDNGLFNVRFNDNFKYPIQSK